MKHKLSLLVMFLIIIVGLYSPAYYSQIPTYTMTITNDSVYNDNVYEFDIFLLRTGTTPFELSQWQGGLLFNNNIKGSGTLTATWVPLSFDTALVTSGQVNQTINVATPGVIKIAAKLPTGGPGKGAIVSSTAPGIRLGRLRLTSSTHFGQETANLKYSFNVNPYATKVNAYIAGVGTVITDSTKHFMITTNPLLPVELTSFMSNVNGRQVDLKWETKTEVNTRHFEIDRALVSSNGATETWVSVGIVQASGTSTTPKKYSYSEKNLQAGKYQYRLKMIDNDGSYKFSDAVETEIALPKNFELSQNYPNPFNPSTRINYSIPFDSRVTLEVYNIAGEKMGQIVSEEQSAGFYTANFSSSTLNRSIASGVYIYKLNAVDKSTGNVFTSIKKMMLLK
jgi:hypothetical protein